MSSADQVFEEIEKDRAQRESEIRLIENIAARTESEAERDMLRRSLVLLTYATFEGFCKFSLLAFAGAINSLGVACRDAATPVVAASLGETFAALRDVNSKHRDFASKLPDDRDLHMLERQRVFIEKFGQILSARVEIPDKLIDTKSNLSSIVLKRNLYQLGLEYPAVEKYRSDIDKLLGVRNAIAHGDRLKIPSQREVEQYIEAAFNVMKFVQEEVHSALKKEVYLKPDRRGRSMTRPLPKASLFSRLLGAAR